MDLSTLQQLVPAVAVTIVLSYVNVQQAKASAHAQESSEKAHEAKTNAFLKALSEKDEKFSLMVNGQFAKSNAALNELTNVLKELSTKIALGGKNTRIKE